MPFIPKLKGGLFFPQTYCARLDSENVLFTDDAVFAEHKKSIFHIVVLLQGLEEVKPTAAELDDIGYTWKHLSAAEATSFVPRMPMKRFSGNGSCDLPGDRVFRTASADEFAQSDLCLRRPEPRGYNEMLMRDSMAGERYAILRPDRFVFAACSDMHELRQAPQRLAEMF